MADFGNPIIVGAPFSVLSTEIFFAVVGAQNDQGMAAARRIGARSTWLTHMNHESTHAELEDYCAKNGDGLDVRPSWDGLELEI